MLPRIIIDTDAGVDDANAIVMVLAAHARGLVNLAAITTTHGNTPLANVNKNVLRLLDCTNFLGQIPVFSGAVHPLVHPHGTQPEQPCHGKDGFGDSNLPHPDPEKFLEKEAAAVKIVQEVEAFPGCVHLLTLGPLTNVAVAKMLDSRLLVKLASLHVMGGNTTGLGNRTNCAEFNFMFDPEAAQNVLSRPPRKAVKSGSSEEDTSCPVYITPLETCVQTINFPVSFREELGQHDTKQAKMLNLAHAGCAIPTLYQQWATFDELAAARMLDILLGDAFLPVEDRSSYVPLSTASVDCNVTVELQGCHARGQMILDRKNCVNYAIPASILTSVNVNLYKRYLKSAFAHVF
ncbi:Inosine/uridine-preferring nucleoside hydrolase domain [Trinorchestia longiramus]|nr:Inosine/uridine-preferring nucleoside hydrolase domain [Trinorchestia longiramus]